MSQQNQCSNLLTYFYVLLRFIVVSWVFSALMPGGHAIRIHMSCLNPMLNKSSKMNEIINHVIIIFFKARQVSDTAEIHFLLAACPRKWELTPMMNW